MKRVFIDTNVVLDFVLCREGEQKAMDVFQMGEDGLVQLVVSFLTMANVAYIARKHRSRTELNEYLRELASLFHILPMDEAQFNEALNNESPDFEDMLQYQCAVYHNCDVIITNNTKHFVFSEIKVQTPSEFLIKNNELNTSK